MRNGGKSGGPRAPKDDPGGNRYDCQAEEERPERDEGLLGCRKLNARLLARHILRGALAALELSLHVRLPRGEFGADERQANKSGRREQIDPKPGRIGDGPSRWLHANYCSGRAKPDLDAIERVEPATELLQLFVGQIARLVTQWELGDRVFELAEGLQ